MAPQVPQSMLFFRRVFDGYLGYGDDRTLASAPVTSIEVDQPMTIIAAYRSDINTKVLGMVIAFLVGGVFVYAGTEWGRPSTEDGAHAGGPRHLQRTIRKTRRRNHPIAGG